MAIRVQTATAARESAVREFLATEGFTVVRVGVLNRMANEFAGLSLADPAVETLLSLDECPLAETYRTDDTVFVRIK